MRTRIFSTLFAPVILLMFGSLIYIGSYKLNSPYVGVYDGKRTWGVPGDVVVQEGVGGQPFNVQYVTSRRSNTVQTRSQAGFGNRPMLYLDVPTTPETRELMMSSTTN